MKKSKHFSYFKYLLILFLCLSANVIDAQEKYADTKISVISADSGDELYSTFGHTALRVHDSRRGFDYIYNWGVFDFDTPNFYLKFMRGLLPYKLGVTTFDRFLRTYDYQERTLWEQELNLSDNQKAHIMGAIQENLKPENRAYAYDFFYDNCTTRVYDLIDNLDTELVFKNDVKQITFREMLKENLGGMPWTEFGIDLIIGAPADEITTREDQMFLPMYLHDQLNNTDLGPLKTVKSDVLILDHEATTLLRKSSSYNWPYILFAILFIIRLILSRPAYKNARVILDKVLIGITAVASLIMLIMWFGTAHRATNNNWNLLWASPLFMIYPLIKRYKLALVLLIISLVMALINVPFNILPQYYNPTFLFIIIMLLLALYEDYTSINHVKSKIDI